MRYKANAKINLSLDVTGVRENGYHDVRMIMQSIELCDYLDIEVNNSGRIELTCSNPEIECDKSNLIYKAADKLINKAVDEEIIDKNTGVTISLQKNIPIAAGLAGGSTDAAATLVGLNEELGLGYSSSELRGLGVTLGADIPFCIEGGTYLSEGIGEVLSKLKDAPDCFIVLVKPDINVSTKFVYDNLILNEETVHPDVDAMLNAIETGSIKRVADCLDNLLATVTEKEYPIIVDIKNILKENGALNAIMSGSGPTVFGLFDDEEKAKEALSILGSKVEFKQGFVTTFAKYGIKGIE
ncbi:MAG: 4-(cytidine 5'-diphospho)-2-C-methyl-D-erythritol kinase [Lachnospiraceae bacterium]|nr:4-(cytidine 5'-diphospho)-2-C-methyl-D-erythritol kinase [Lachnospiraceae bacterium]